ncbi:MAG: SMC-Scp complex subunit ScpB, partial [Candidatus Eisenbacteria bacterium]|nr:SMC-Scp complex subunit ScpB [Candidatus Eisenbacteria bacterium]
AYRQPITRGELEDLRGVDCGAVIHTLLERDLVTIAGRSSAIGRPLLYRTTERFLEHFGLASLQELPRLEEVEALWASDEVRTQLEFELARRIGDVPGGPPAAGNGDGHSDGNGNGHSDGHRHASDPAGEGDAGGSDGSNGAAGEADLVLALVEGNGHSDAHSDAHSGAHADGGGNGGGNGGGDGERGGDLARRLTVLANPEGSDFSPDEG